MMRTWQQNKGHAARVDHICEALFVSGRKDIQHDIYQYILQSEELSK